MNTGRLAYTGPLRLQLIRNKDFLLLWLGQAVSQIGDRVQQIALVWWALEHGGSVGAVSWALVAGTAPAVLISLFAGVVADRTDRRLLMVTCDLSRALIVAAISFLAWAGQLTFGVLLIATGLVSAIGAFFTPAAMAAVPDLVSEGDLVRANSLQEVTAQIAMVAGPALGGVLVAGLGTAAAFGANATSFFICGTALLAMVLPRRVPVAAGENGWQQLVGGLSVLRSDRAVATLLTLFAIANFFLVPITVFLPYFAKDVFRVGAGGLGILEGTIGIGMLLGALTLAGAGVVHRRRDAVQWGMIVPGASLVIMGTWQSFYGFLTALFALGTALSVLNVVAVAHFQQTVPPEKLGRFMGLLMTVILALMPLSYAAAGIVSTGVSAGAILASGGVVLVLLGLALPFMKPLQPLADFQK